MFSVAAFLSYVFVVNYTPGPNNIMAMIIAGNVGFKKTLHFILGVITGFFIIMLASSFFNLILFTYVPKIKPVMSIIGALYLLYLAAKILGIHFGKAKKEQSDKLESVNKYHIGILLQFVNPKVILFGITIISNFIIPWYSKPYELLLFSLFLSVIAFSATSSWALFGSFLNRIINRYEKIFNIIMSLLLLYSALTILGILN